MTRTRERLLGVALLLTVTSLAVQPVVAAAVTTPYSWTRDAISDLGVVRCDAALCSPWWPVFSVGLLVGGAAMVAVGVLVRRYAAAAVLLVLAGLSTAAVGLVPLDVDRPLHLLVATPLFPAQNLAVLLLGLRLAGTSRAGLVAAGVVGLLGSLAVVAPLGVPFGVAERLGAYPAVIALAALGLSVLHRGLPTRLAAP
ncbi:DUF998 domain-containing protein [Nocardioides marmoraquaticus]